MILPASKQGTLESIVNDLKGIEHVAAIVLGGSHCTGMANENSDLDIGIYYRQSHPFDIDQIKIIARKHNIDEALTVTGFYEWGAWVNGGAWLNTISGEVDFVYRNIDQVLATIEKSKNGIWENDYEQQPPYGFSSVIYLAETYYCHSLYDPHHIIEKMKNEVAEYPIKLKNTIVQQALWSAEFTCWQADKFAQKQDMYNTAGCITRAMKNIIEALFALNELYSIGDKYAIQQITQAPNCPPGIKEQMDDILSIDTGTLTAKTAKLRSLFNQVVSQAGSMYQPYFGL